MTTPTKGVDADKPSVRLEALLTCIVGATTLFVRDGDDKAGVACEDYIQQVKALFTGQLDSLLAELPEKINYGAVDEYDEGYAEGSNAAVRETADIIKQRRDSL